MTSKILLSVYLVIGLLISITTRADEAMVNVPISNIQINAETNSVHVTGNFSNPCVKNARPYVQLISHEEKTILFKMVGTSTAEVCIQVLGPSFSQVIDARAIKHELSRNGYEASGNYKLVTATGSVDGEINLSESILAMPNASTELTGVLAQDFSGLYLLLADGESVRVKSSGLNLELHIGETVTASGHIFSGLRPGLRSASLAATSPTFFVTGIYFTAD